MRLSASKIKTFTACRRKYYYQYLEHLDTEDGVSAVLGRCVHKAIELGYTKNNDPLRIFSEEWTQQIKGVIDQKNSGRAYNDGLKMINLYHFDDRDPPVEMEFEFSLPFPGGNDYLCTMVGIIDQIFADGIIVDLKTSVQKPKQGVLDNNPQFILYSWAYEQIYGSKPRIYWHHLRTGEMLEAHVEGQEKLQNIIDIVASMVNTQLSRDIKIWHQNVGFECNICPFRKPCLGSEN